MKWALIIGSSGDIGIQIAKDLADLGWSLYLHFNKNKSRILKLSKYLGSIYIKQDFIPIQSNFLSKSFIHNIINSIFQLDAIIFSQGNTSYNFLDVTSMDKINEIIRIHLTAPIEIIKNTQSKLSKSDNGRIIFISSIYGKNGSAMEVPYSTVKGAINTFVSAYSKEVISLGITVNAIAPGAVLTQMNKKMFSDDDIKMIKDELPIGYLATPKDISYWVRVLINKDSRYMTGQTLYVTGGWLF